MLKYSKFADWLFYALLSYFAYSITTDISSMKNSIVELNVNVSRVVTQQAGAEKNFDKLEQRVYNLEGKWGDK